MTASRVTHIGRWSGVERVDGEDAAAHAAADDLINILDTVEVPIVVVRRDLMIDCFNKAAADMLGLSSSDIGRALPAVSVLAGLPRLQQQSDEVINGGVESRVDLRHARSRSWFGYPHGCEVIGG